MLAPTPAPAAAPTAPRTCLRLMPVPVSALGVVNLLVILKIPQALPHSSHATERRLREALSPAALRARIGAAIYRNAPIVLGRAATAS